MSIDDFLAKLEGVQAGGGGWVARCPAHGDDNPSLSVSRGEDGRILIHCHAGCSAEDVVQSMGLKMSDLMPANERPSRTIKGRWGKWVCDYVYTDEVGKVLYKSCRYVKDGKKTFIIKVPDPKAKFGWGFGLSKSNIERVPYHLPQIVEAARKGKSVVIVEGEKDADNVERVCRCVATCNVAGALKWGFKFPKDWGRWFDGVKNILVIADNDPQFKTVEKRVKGEVVTTQIEHWRGQKHAVDVRRQLRAVGYKGEIRLMVMPQVEGQPHVKDFTDWLEARKAAGMRRPGRRNGSLTVRRSLRRRRTRSGRSVRMARQIRMLPAPKKTAPAMPYHLPQVRRLRKRAVSAGCPPFPPLKKTVGIWWITKCRQPGLRALKSANGTSGPRAGWSARANPRAASM